MEARERVLCLSIAGAKRVRAKCMKRVNPTHCVLPFDMVRCDEMSRVES